MLRTSADDPRPPVTIVIFLGLLFGLLFGEACYQRHVHRKREFLSSLETLSASLGDFDVANVTMRSAYTRFATAALRVLEEGRRRESP